jgi:hypothetical protein
MAGADRAMSWLVRHLRDGEARRHRIQLLLRIGLVYDCLAPVERELRHQLVVEDLLVVTAHHDERVEGRSLHPPAEFLDGGPAGRIPGLPGLKGALSAEVTTAGRLEPSEVVAVASVDQFFATPVGARPLVPLRRRRVEQRAVRGTDSHRYLSHGFTLLILLLRLSEMARNPRRGLVR